MAYLVLIGSQNRVDDDVQDAEGLAVHGFDPASGLVETLHVEKGADNPSYFTLNGDMVYAVNEVGVWPECTVSAYRLDRGTGALAYVNKQPTRGLTTCHVAVLPGERLAVANYAAGSGGPDQAVCFYPLQDDGAIGAPYASAAHFPAAGTVGRDRSHGHCVLPTADGAVALVADLGLDCIIGYDVATGKETLRLSLASGIGPRHLVNHQNGRVIYVINELKPFVSVLEWDGATLQHLADVPTHEGLAEGAATHGAAIQISADGRFLYASTRGVDTVSVFAVGSDGRQLTLVQAAPCGGKWPRDFALTPSGEHVLVANQHSGAVAILARNAETGNLTDTGQRIAAKAPQCVKIVERSAA